ncbi:MAG: ABC transporter ATP-binding protein [Chloroflexota bacterium]|nr:ABC transporter ATP-binding protein [Chloroflexota bacterium]
MSEAVQPILRTEGLTKVFGAITAVQGLSIELRPGEVLGFLGPNGSGKSTTIGMVLGLIRPTAGSVELFGRPLAACGPEEFSRIGAVLENTPLYPFLSGHDNLEVLARLNQVDERRIREVLELVGLTERARSKVHTYSLGMKQRLSLATALLSDPQLLFLDEPTNGMDPSGMLEVRNLVKQLVASGKAVFLSSHLLHEVEQICTRVVIIKGGRVQAQGTLAELLKPRSILQIRVPQPDEALRVLQQQPWVTSSSFDGQYVVVETDGDHGQDVTAALAKQGIYASEMKPREESLEAFFQEVTGSEQRKDTAK